MQFNCKFKFGLGLSPRPLASLTYVEHVFAVMTVLNLRNVSPLQNRHMYVYHTQQYIQSLVYYRNMFRRNSAIFMESIHQHLKLTRVCYITVVMVCDFCRRINP